MVNRRRRRRIIVSSIRRGHGRQGRVGAVRHNAGHAINARIIRRQRSVRHDAAVCEWHEPAPSGTAPSESPQKKKKHNGVGVASVAVIVTGTSRRGRAKAGVAARAKGNMIVVLIDLFSFRLAMRGRSVATRGRDHTRRGRRGSRPADKCAHGWALPTCKGHGVMPAQYQASVFNLARTWESIYLNFDLDTPPRLNMPRNQRNAGVRQAIRHGECAA
jgi:hypothetical protein